MRKFKFYLAAFAIALCAGFSSCSSEYDDSEIWEKVNELVDRVQKLEASVQQQNANITALQTMLDAIKDNVYVTSVEELADGKGYSLKLSNGKEVKIYHGEDGKDAESPSITIIKEGDNYYWSVNGEILKDDEGNNIPADGGAADVLPQLKTGSQLEAEGVSGQWEKDAVYVTTDHVIWKKVNVGDSTGTSIFTSVEISEDGTTIIITLSDGSTISIPKSSKIQEMLYGGWISGTEINDERWCWIFHEDGTVDELCLWGEDALDLSVEVESGLFRFLPDNYIYTSFYDTWYNGSDSWVGRIVEITKDNVIFDGNSAEEEFLTRLTASEIDLYYSLAFAGKEIWSDGVNDYHLNADGTGKFNSETISWKVENFKLVITKINGETLLNRKFRFISSNNVVLSGEDGIQLKWFALEEEELSGTWTCKVFGENSEVVETYSVVFGTDGRASVEKDGAVAYSNYLYVGVDELSINVIDQFDGVNYGGRLLDVQMNRWENASEFPGTLYYWTFDVYGWHCVKKYNVVLTQ